MAMTTDADFFALLEKSNLLSTEQLAEARALAAPGADPRTIARALAQKGMLTRWQAGQLLAGRSTFFLGKYKLIDLLGRGGMGHVFLGSHVTMNRRVALKIISRAVSKNPAALERFLCEARAIASLDHPNIVQAYSVDNEGERYYLVMEYVDGQDLQRLVEADGPLDFARAADFIRQAADGLAHAHQRKMIHCDIKPSNLLVNQQGVIKILDLGLARLDDRDEPAPEESEDQVLGSVDYLAPEQALKSEDFDHRADIYSLGCTLFFLLTGAPPFGDGTIPERILKHQTVDPPDILQLRPDAPKDLVEICKKMMAKKPGDRYQTAEELGRVLSRWRPPERKIKRAVALVDESDVEGEVAQAAGAAGAVAPIKPGGKRRAVKGFVNPLKGLKLNVALSPRAKIIAAVVGGVVGLLSLLGGTAALFFYLGHRGTTEVVAQAEPEKEKAETPEGESGKTEAEKAEKPGEGEGEKKEETKEKEPATKDKEAEEEEPKTPKPKPAKKEDKESGKTKKGKTEEEPAPEDEKPKPSKPEKEEAPEPKPKPRTQPRPTPKPPAAPEDPLRALKAVDLPAVAEGGEGQAAGPTSLGAIAAAPDSKFAIALLGGAKALKGKKFELREEEGADKKPGWVVEEKGTKSTGKSEDIARLWVEKDSLQFQWLSGATKTAGALRNCALKLTSGTHERAVPLCQPKPIEPIVVDLTKGGSTINLPLEMPPDPHSLQLQFLKTDGGGTKPRVYVGQIHMAGAVASKPPKKGPKKKDAEAAGPDLVEGDRTSPDKPSLFIYWADAQQNVKVGVKVTLKANVRATMIETTNIFQGSDFPYMPFPKGPTGCKMLAESYAAMQRQSQGMAKLPAGDPRKLQADKIDQVAKAMPEVQKIYDAVQGKARIYFRVVVADEENTKQPVCLCESSAAAAAAGGGGEFGNQAVDESITDTTQPAGKPQRKPARPR